MEIFFRKNASQEKERKEKYKNNKDIRSHEVFMLIPLCESTKNICQDFLFFSCLNTKP